ncbi:MAG: hypothetical protein J0H41_12595 [Rhizobiales bacterium]|nr:hypothetical protein [Hyphomicrobiales bacterium]
MKRAEDRPEQEAQVSDLMLAMKSAFLAGVIACAAVISPALAQSTPAAPSLGDGPVGEGLSGEALRREVSGATIAGFHLRTMMRFSEYHSPDGRILGHNGGVPVDRGCWEVKADEVCYYYEGDTLPQGTWCWTFNRLANANQYRLEHRASGGLALGVRQPGNPNNWSDNGKPWQCTGMISRRETPNQSRLAQKRP